MAVQSCDITTGCDLQEVDNAVNQAMKEIRQRYDFKGMDVGVVFRRGENKLVLHAPDDFKLKAVWDVVQEKMVRRRVPLKKGVGLSFSRCLRHDPEVRGWRSVVSIGTALCPAGHRFIPRCSFQLDDQRKRVAGIDL